MIPKSILVFGEPKKSTLEAPISTPYSSPEYYQDDEYSIPEIPKQPENPELPEKPILDRFQNAFNSICCDIMHQNH